MTRQLLHCQAFVLHSQPYRERDLLVSLLSAQQGMLRGIARSARGGRGRQLASYELCTPVHVHYQLPAPERPHADSSLRPHPSAPSVWCVLRKNPDRSLLR